MANLFLIVLFAMCGFMYMRLQTTQSDFRDLEIRSSMRLKHLEHSLFQLEQRFSALLPDDCDKALESSRI